MNLKCFLRDSCLPELKAGTAYFSLEMIRDYLDRRKIAWKPATLNRYLVELCEGGFIHDAGRGWYSSLAEPFELDTQPVQELIATLERQFPLLDFSCWSTQQVAMFGHHLLTKFVIFVYTDRDAMESVHAFLQASGHDAWLNPRGTEARRFTIRENTVVVRPRVTTQPVKHHIVPTEGLLVDLFVENRSLGLMDTTEFFATFANAIQRGRVSMSLLLDYSGKRKTAAADLVESIIGENTKYSLLID